MKKLACVIMFCLFAATAAFSAEDAVYEGGFSEIHSTGDVCDDVFSITDYTVKFFFAGPTGYTTVIYFENENDRGFLNTVNMVGRMGGSGDVFYEKGLLRDGIRYHFEADGIASRDLLLLDFSVVVKDQEDQVICNVTSEYFGN